MFKNWDTNDKRKSISYCLTKWLLIDESFTDMNLKQRSLLISHNLVLFSQKRNSFSLLVFMKILLSVFVWLIKINTQVWFWKKSVKMCCSNVISDHILLLQTKFGFISLTPDSSSTTVANICGRSRCTLTLIYAQSLQSTAVRYIVYSKFTRCSLVKLFKQL